MASAMAVATKKGTIPAAAIPHGQRVVQYHRLRRNAKIDLLRLAKVYGVSIPNNHVTAQDPPDAQVTNALDGVSGPSQALTADEQHAIARILRQHTSEDLATLHTSILPSVYESGPVSAFEAYQGRVIEGDDQLTVATNNFNNVVGKPLLANPKTTGSRDPGSYNTISGGVPMDYWGVPLTDAGGNVNSKGELECGAPQTGHGVEGDPCNCVLGDDLTCHYHP